MCFNSSTPDQAMLTFAVTGEPLLKPFLPKTPARRPRLLLVLRGGKPHGPLRPDMMRCQKRISGDGAIDCEDGL